MTFNMFSSKKKEKNKKQKNKKNKTKTKQESAKVITKRKKQVPYVSCQWIYKIWIQQA